MGLFFGPEQERNEMYRKNQQKKDELRMDWAIASAKAAYCLRRYQSTDDRKWLLLAEAHLATANGYLQELDRVWLSVADPCEWLGAERVGSAGL